MIETLFPLKLKLSPGYKFDFFYLHFKAHPVLRFLATSRIIFLDTKPCIKRALQRYFESRFETSWLYLTVSGKMPPGKKPPEKMPPRKLPSGKLPPGNNPTRKLPPGKMPPKKIDPLKIAPQENCFTRFLLLLTLSYSSSFLNFL